MNLNVTEVLSAAPFGLDEAGIAWVEQHLHTLSLDDKIAQLFVLMLMDEDPSARERINAFKPGGVLRILGDDLAAERQRGEELQAAAEIPLLMPADTEGSRQGLRFGTPVPNPLGVAAIDDESVQATVCEIMAGDAAAVGVNMSYTPVVDICAKPRSAIVPTRSFGSDVDRISRLASRQVKTLQANGIAATAKHWPGEGFDDRDQHLVTTINPLSVDEWRATFGRLYSDMIESGVMAVMSAHIALPSYVAAHDPDADLELYRPASVSKLLNRTLLRDELGFNGVVVSDATPMAGLGSWASYDVTIPELIENGCDVVLFSDDPEADRNRIKAALDDGRLSPDRIDDALVRVLGLKAALGLHRADWAPVAPETKPPAGDVARDIVARVPTLVKDVAGVLPLSVEAHRKLYIYSTGVVTPFGPPTEFAMLDMLRDEGFDVTVHEGGFDSTPWAGHDAVLYLLGEESLLTRQNIFLNWAQIGGNYMQAMKRPWHELPTALVSFGHPFYLYDAPRMPCLINAYSGLDIMQAAVVDCLLGRAPFLGTSPVDPTAGVPDALL